MQRYDLNLCKVHSNAQLVSQAYPPDEPPPDTINLKERDPTLNEEQTTSLGMQWHLQSDVFSIKTEDKLFPKTKRGLYAHIGSIYDPLGFCEPVKLAANLLRREMVPRKGEDPHGYHAMDWDDPIPSHFHKEWDKMVATSRELKDLSIPRPYYPSHHGTPIHQQLHAFADASDSALCHVIYLRTVTSDNTIHVAFVRGSSKVLPKGVCIKGQLSIPRAELNAAKDLTEKVLEVEKELDLPNLHPTIFYSDSRDVLAWVKNDMTNENPKRYVMTRITTIRTLSNPK